MRKTIAVLLILGFTLPLAAVPMPNTLKGYMKLFKPGMTKQEVQKITAGWNTKKMILNKEKYHILILKGVSLYNISFVFILFFVDKNGLRVLEEFRFSTGSIGHKYRVKQKSGVVNKKTFFHLLKHISTCFGKGPDYDSFFPTPSIFQELKKLFPDLEIRMETFKNVAKIVDPSLSSWTLSKTLMNWIWDKNKSLRVILDPDNNSTVIHIKFMEK